MTKETTLRLAEHLIPSLDSEEKQITIRYGTRDFEQNITIADRPAVVDSVEHFALMDIPLCALFQDGFDTFRDALECLKEFYPDITPESPMTVVRFHLSK